MKRYFVDFTMGFTWVDTDATDTTGVSTKGVVRALIRF